MSVSDEQTDNRVPLIVGVTAHRDLVAEEIPAIRKLIREFLEDLGRQYPDLPLKLMCPLAEGGDSIAAREALALGIPLIAPLPLPRELYLEDFKDDASRGEFEELLSRAEVLELPLAPGNTLESISVPGEPRDLQYAQLGVFLSGHCQVLLAIWDGKPSDRIGGTAEVVRYHHEGEMAGFTDGVLDPQQILAEAENDLVYHIACSRNRPGGGPVEGLAPLEAQWFCADPVSPRTEKQPRRYAQMFRTTEEFNRDVRRYSGRIEAEARSLTSGAQTGVVTATLAGIENMFAIADWLANHFQTRVSLSLKLTYTLAVMMGLAFIAYTDIPDQRLMIYAFLLFFGIGFVLYTVAEKRAWHRKYLDYRGLAEGLRVQFYWSVAGVTAGERTKFAHDNFLQKQDVELGWIRNAMRVASLHTDGESSLGADGGLELAIREWIGQADGEQGGQIRYYAHQVEERSRRHSQTQAIGLACLWAGIAVTVFLALFDGLLEASQRDPLIIMMGVLPLIAAVREAYANKKAEKELIKQYRFMHKIFANARRRLLAAASTREKRAILRALGDAALDEHAEWILMHRERPLEHGKL